MAVYGYMTITCNAAISACGQGREWPRALDVLGVMARSSIQIDTITCNVAVSACEKGREWAHANPLALHLLMAQTNGNSYGYGHCLQ